MTNITDLLEITSNRSVTDNSLPPPQARNTLTYFLAQQQRRNQTVKNNVLSAILLAQDRRKNATVEVNVTSNWKVAPVEEFHMEGQKI